MRKALALACVGGLTAAAFAGSPAVAGSPATTGPDGLARVGGFDGARGFDIGVSGKTVVATADGTVTRVTRFGPKAGTKRVITRVPGSFVAPAVAVADDNAVWVLTGGAETPTEGQGTLWLKKAGEKKQAVVNIQQWVADHAKGADPYDLESTPHESNPYGVASLPGGAALVADAANNAVFRVTRSGKVSVVARVKPRVVPNPFEDPAVEGDENLPTEAVTTSVAVGPDGSVYIGELRGAPSGTDVSQVWRVAPGARNAVCDPATPKAGTCTRVADGLTSVVGLDAGEGGALYVAELSKMGWMSLEGGAEGSEVGAVIRISHDRSVRRELSPGKVILPGAVAVDSERRVYVSGPIFGPGGFRRVS